MIGETNRPFSMSLDTSKDFMPKVFTTTGIVTKYVNYKDNDRILSVFTVDHGRIDLKAKGCRRPKSPLAPVAQPFVYAEFDIYSDKDKNTVNQATVLESFFPIREKIDAFTVASSCLQLAHEAVQIENVEKDLFQLLYYTLSYLAYSESNPKDLFIYFLANYLSIIGYKPALTKCARCGLSLIDEKRVFYSPEAGGAVCENCRYGGFETGKTELEAIRRILLLNCDDMQKVVLKNKMQSEIMRILTVQIEHSFEYGTKALSFYSDFLQQTENIGT